MKLVRTMFWFLIGFALSLALAAPARAAERPVLPTNEEVGRLITLLPQLGVVINEQDGRCGAVIQVGKERRDGEVAFFGLDCGGRIAYRLTEWSAVEADGQQRQIDWLFYRGVARRSESLWKLSRFEGREEWREDGNAATLVIPIEKMERSPEEYPDFAAASRRAWELLLKAGLQL